MNENIAAASIGNIETFPFALGGATGLAAMIASEGRSQDHRISSLLAEVAPRVQVLSFRDVLQQTGEKQVALFKCDIEGSENELFANVGQEDLEKVDRFAIEFHDNLKPGTLSLLNRVLSATHTIIQRGVDKSKDGYGMLYAVKKYDSAASSRQK